MKRTLSLLPLVLAAALFASCKSKDLYSKNQTLLTNSFASYEAGEYERAVNQAKGLVVQTSGDAAKYQVQRFFAAFVAVQAHSHAAFGGRGGFLAEPRSKSTMSLGGAGGSRDFSVPHAVAAARMIGYGYDWTPATAPPSSVLDAQLPAELAALGVDNATLNINLSLLAIYARLGFRARINEIFDSNPTMLTLEGSEQLMDSARLPAPLRPWLTWAVFQYLVTEQNDKEAYRFAVRTLFPGDEESRNGMSVGRDLEDELRTWITDGSAWVFYCSS